MHILFQSSKYFFFDFIMLASCCRNPQFYMFHFCWSRLKSIISFVVRYITSVLNSNVALCHLSLLRKEKRKTYLSFYRTRVRSLVMLVTNWLTNWLANSLPFSKLDWCDPGIWRWQLKTYWGCYCCWFWWWGSCWQQSVAYFGAEAW